MAARRRRNFSLGLKSLLPEADKRTEVEMFQKYSRSIALFIFLSLLIHLSLGTGLLKFSSPKTAKKQIVEIEYIQKPEGSKAVEQPQAQIVEQERRVNEETPEKSKYLSKYDQTVKEETRALKTGEFRNAAKAGVQKIPAPRKTPPKEPTPRKLAKGELPSLKNLVPELTATPKAQQQEEGQAGDPSQTDDHLKDTKTGIQTLLSTREFVYYSYYQRIKDQIRQYWGPNIQEKVKIIYRKGRSIASASDRVTQVVVTLNQKGELEAVEVIGESGVKDFDDAAVEAFKAAAPFPNPPKGIVEKDGRIRIRWDFILEASSSTGRAFRKIARN
jgi:protein TonB